MSQHAPAETGDALSIRVVLADDHEIFRGGVRSMLKNTEFLVVGEASSSAETLEVVLKVRPDVVLLDIRMIGGDGLDTLRVLKQNSPRTIVVMLTTYDNPTYMARAVAGGAAGYLLKGVSRAALVEALRAVAAGEMLLTRENLLYSLRGISADAAGSRDLIEPLTNREHDVLRLLATGLSNREMAAVLFVSEHTVKTHVDHILGKLGVSDRVQAAVWAARHGLAECNDEALNERRPGGLR